MTAGKHVQRVESELRDILHPDQGAVGERADQVPHAGHQALRITDLQPWRGSTVQAPSRNAKARPEAGRTGRKSEAHGESKISTGVVLVQTRNGREPAHRNAEAPEPTGPDCDLGPVWRERSVGGRIIQADTISRCEVNQGEDVQRCTKKRPGRLPR